MARYTGAQDQFTRGMDNGARLARVRSINFDLDNGAGTTVDDVVLRPAVGITITAARIVYTGDAAGVVAAGNVKIGTAVGGAQVVLATAYVDSSAVGAVTNLAIVGTGAVAAATPVIVRHTGVAATAAGSAYVELEYRET